MSVSLPSSCTVCQPFASALSRGKPGRLRMSDGEGSTSGQYAWGWAEHGQTRVLLQPTVQTHNRKHELHREDKCWQMMNDHQDKIFLWTFHIFRAAALIACDSLSGEICWSFRWYIIWSVRAHLTYNNKIYGCKGQLPIINKDII